MIEFTRKIKAQDIERLRLKKELTGGMRSYEKLVRIDLEAAERGEFTEAALAAQKLGYTTSLPVPPPNGPVLDGPIYDFYQPPRHRPQTREDRAIEAIGDGIQCIIISLACWANWIIFEFLEFLGSEGAEQFFKYPMVISMILAGLFIGRSVWLMVKPKSGVWPF